MTGASGHASRFDDERRRLRASHAALECRHTVCKSIRAFFDQQGFLEIETPVRLRAPALERHIDAEPAGALFLRTSPELHMKRMLAAGFDEIYQMGPCFRRGEHGAMHHAEYTMLEWYRVDADYHTILDDTRGLIRAVSHAARGGEWTWQERAINVDAEWPVITVRDAFMRWAGWDPVAAYDADRFDLDLVERVEPELRSFTTPVVLTDYPAPAAALARRKPDDPAVAERWELYMAGIEIANAYSELTDATEQEARFRACAQQRGEAGLTVYPLDETFLDALRAGLPPCGGIALGVDRLVMLLADAPTIADVTAFQEM